MSTFYTAPPIYNTGGWGFRGDIPIFNPTGSTDNVLETGKVAVSTSDIQYFTKENRKNVKLKIDPTFNLNNFIAPRIDFEINPSIENARKKTNNFNFELQPALSLTKSIKKELKSRIDPVFNLARQERLSTRNKVNPTLEAINYFYSNSDKSLIAKNENTFGANIFSASLTRDALGFTDTQISYFNESYIKGRNFLRANANYFAEASLRGKNYLRLEANYFGAAIDKKLKYSINPTIHHVKRFSKFYIENELNEILNFKSSSTRELIFKYSTNLFHVHNERRSTRIKYSILPSFYKTAGEKLRGRATIHNNLNLNYFVRDDFEGVSSANISLNNITKFREPFYKGFTKNRLSDVSYLSKSFIKGLGESRLSDVNYFSTSFERFSETNTLNRIDYNPDPVPKEAKTESSFPTGVEFPKIRYQTAEPDYTKASTGSNTYGYLQYEGIEEGNLFYYEPDTGAYQWEYFHYGIRSGIFNPCEFPETADRTLDPVQISSRSNKKDNPYWYLPDLLTVDSTIHLADGAPCQYIAQENSRYAEIFLEDGLLLLPENYTNTGQLYTI
tara:strand:- start:9 stop:1685 length:1677 start_codon:yes stop_codon:yes gene_type:complete